MLDARAELGVPGLGGRGAGALLGRHPWPALHRLDLTSATRTWPMPSRIGSFGLRESGAPSWPWRTGSTCSTSTRGDWSSRPGRSGCRAPGSTTARSRRTAGSSPGRWTRRCSPPDRHALPARSGPEPAPGGREPDRVQRSGLDRRRPHDVPLRQQGPGGLGLRLRPRQRCRRPTGGRSRGRPRRSAGPTAGRPTSRATTGAPASRRACSTGGRPTAGSTAASRCRARTPPRRASAAGTCGRSSSPRCGTTSRRRCSPPSRCRAGSSPSGSTSPACRSAASAAGPPGRSTPMLNICMVGHGMMGSGTPRRSRACRTSSYTVVGRKPAPVDRRDPTTGRKPPSTEEFATGYGYKKWTTDLGEARRSRGRHRHHRRPARPPHGAGLARGGGALSRSPSR